MKSKNNYESNIEENPLNNINSEKKSKMPYILSFLVLLVITLGGVGVWFYINNYSKIVFETFIKNTVDYTKSNMNMNYKTTSTTFDMKFKIDPNEENPLVDILNNLDLSGKVNIDYKNNLALLTLDSKYDKGRLVDGDILYKDSEAYIMLNDVYNKYIKVDIDEKKFTKNTDPEDIKTLINSAFNAMSGSLKNEYFTRSFVGNLSKVSLKLNKKNIGEISSQVLLKLKSDENFLKSLSKVSETDKVTVLKKLNKAIEEATEYANSKDTKDLIIISVYTKKNSKSVIKVEIEDKKDNASLVLEQKDNKTYTLDLDTGTEKLTTEVIIDGGKIELESEGITEKGTFKFNLDLETKFNERFEEPDVTKNTPIEDITEEEFATMEENLMYRKGIQKFILDYNELVDLLDIPNIKEIKL